MEYHREERAGIRLNIGAGETEWGDVQLDIDHTDQVTILGDLHSLPFVDNVCSEILLDNVLEHSPDTTGVLREIYRILRPGGIVYIFVPYYNSSGAFRDPTHRSFFSEGTFDYYTEKSDYDYYADFEFQQVSQSFFYSKLLRPLPSDRIKLKLGHMIGDLVLAMKVILRKPGSNPVEPSIDGWIQS
jgi:predicted SAM-dependent methyltransferase